MITLNENKKLFLEAQQLRKEARTRIHKNASNSYNEFLKKRAFSSFRKACNSMPKLFRL